MKVELIMLTVGAIAWSLLAQLGFAQRGIGDPVGIASQRVKPTVTTYSGTVLTVLNEPCKLTTGRAYVGTHFLMKASEAEELNIHLGPQALVDDVSDRLTMGDSVTVAVFRTERMPKGHFVAKSVNVGDQTIHLRDDSLRPRWAGKRSSRDQSFGSRMCRGWGPGNGDRFGRGYGWRHGWQR
jgi:hypothetical protein